MRNIFTYMLVRNLSRINIECLFLRKPIINKTENKTDLAIKDHKHVLYYSLSL